MTEVKRQRKRWTRIAKRHPSAFLLAAQLLSLLVYPLIDNSHGGRLLAGAVSLVVMLLTVWVVNRSSSANLLVWLLAGSALLLSLGASISHMDVLMPFAAGIEAALYFYAAGSLIMYMMRDFHVTADDLFCAGATFTLLAWGFAYAYFVCQSWYPGSFTGSVEPQRDRTWMELLFLSFTNLSATGSGDIYPVSAQARVLVMLEQFAGVGYIAVVVSRLIGLTIIRHKSNSKG